MTEKILIYDLETATPEGKPVPDKDRLKLFGCYSYITQKYYYLTSIKDIRKIIDAHDIFVGFNNLQYDNAVLYHNGFNDIIDKNKYGDYKIKYKVNIDLMQIIKSRASGMKIKGGLLSDLLMRHSLDFITRLLNLVDDSTAKKEFDYSKLNREMSKEEWAELKSYLKRDIDITKKLYEWVEEYFKGFKPFLNEKDVNKKKYLTCSMAVFAYKAICKRLDMREEYSDKEEHEAYGGGYVAYPAGDHFEGDIYCLDFNSLYPHIFSQCNLFSKDVVGWDGNNKFQVKGIYNDKQQGKIEKLIIDFYKERLELKKKKDPREYSIKVIINTMYGMTGNSSFKQLYNYTAASDCTLLGRQWVKLARRRFYENKYEIIYTDTDSVYIGDPFDNKEKMLKIKDQLIKEIKDNVPFPQITFDMGIDDEISHIWFFKGNGNSNKESDKEMDELDMLNKPKGFMKKNYLYLTKNGELKYKNLGVRKKSVSTLTRYIFSNILIPKIKEEKKVKFTKTFFMNKITKLLDEDLSLACVRYKVNKVNTYKSKNSIQAQIADKHGPGIHFLIPNKKIGVGKGKFYCTIEEFKKCKLTINDIDLINVYRELEYFTMKEKPVDLSTWGL